MNDNQLFQKTRWRLTLWYTSVMGIILAVCGLGLYEAIAHAHHVTLNREIKSVAGTFHDSLELTLQEPGKLEPEANRLLPSLCLVETDCSQKSNSSSHKVGGIAQGSYYLRLLNTSGHLVAVAGIQPEGLVRLAKQQPWEHLKAQNGTRYHQISLTLETKNNRPWGYLQVGRSLQDFDRYVANVRWILFLGLPLAMLLVTISAWWLAGLAMQPIYRSYQQIQQFTADAAHELRTPLAAIRATVESTLMMPNLKTIEARETLETINRQNQRLANLVADLLLLSRMERKLFPRDRLLSPKERVFLNDLVTDLAEEFAALALDARISLSHQIKTPKAIEVAGDGEQLYRLVSNLVMNAIQYTPAGGKVRLILERDNNYALIHVKDTGIGIPPAEQTRIFDRFYRVQSDRSRHTGGSGLGLAIAIAIAKGNQGSIKIKSELGKGSNFTFRISL